MTINRRIGPPHAPLHKKVMAHRAWKDLTENEQSLLAMHREADPKGATALYDLWRAPGFDHDADDGITVADISSILDHPIVIIERAIGLWGQEKPGVNTCATRITWRANDVILEHSRTATWFIRIDGFEADGEIVRPLTVVWDRNGATTTETLEPPVDAAAFAARVITFIEEWDNVGQ